MAAFNDKLSFTIDVESGSADSELTKLTTEFNALVDTIKKPLGEIKSFVELKTKLGDTQAALKDAQKEVAGLAVKLKESDSPSKALSSSFERARERARGLKDALAAQQAELQTLRTSLTNAGVNTSALANEQVRLKRSLDQSAESYRSQKAAMEQAGAQKQTTADARTTLGLPQAGQATAELAKITAAYQTLKTSSTATASELAAAQQKVLEKTRELEKGTLNWSDALGQAKGSIAGLVAGTAGWGMAISAAKNFETAMSDVAKVVDAPAEKLKQLEQTIIGLSRVIPMTAVDLAKIAEAGGQMGIKADQIEEFVTAVSKIGTAFKMSSEDAGKMMGVLMNIWQTNVGGISQLADVVNVMGNNFNTTESKISEVMTRIGAMPKMFGLAANETAALATAVLSLGKPPMVAATGINALLSRLQTASAQTPEFKAALASIGISARQLASDIADNPQQALMKFLETLKSLDKKRKPEILTQLFGQEYQDDVATVVEALDLYKRALGMATDQTAVAGSVQKEYERGMQTLDKRWQLAKNSVQELGIVLGSALLPALESMTTAGTGAVNAITNIAKLNPVLTDIVLMLGTAATSFGALTLVGKAAGPAISAAFSPVVGILSSARGQMSEFATVVQGGVTSFSNLRLAIAGATFAAAGLAAYGAFKIFEGMGEAEQATEGLRKTAAEYGRAADKFKEYATLKRSTTDELKAMNGEQLQSEADTVAKTMHYWDKLVQGAKTAAEAKDAMGLPTDEAVKASAVLPTLEKNLAAAKDQYALVGWAARQSGAELEIWSEKAEAARKAAEKNKEAPKAATDRIKIATTDFTKAIEQNIGLLATGEDSITEFNLKSQASWEKHQQASQKFFQESGIGIKQWGADSKLAYQRQANELQASIQALEATKGMATGEDLARYEQMIEGKKQALAALTASTATNAAQVEGAMKSMAEGALANILTMMSQVDLKASTVNPITGMLENADAKLQPFIQKLQGMRDEGVLSFDAMSAHLSEFFSKMSAKDLGPMLDGLKNQIAGMDQSAQGFGDTGGKLAWILQDGVGGALAKLSVDAEKFKSGMTTAGKEMIGTLDVLLYNTNASTEQIGGAFEQVIPHIANLVEATHIEGRLNEMFQAGKISSDDFGKAMDVLQAKMGDLAAAADPVEQAFKRMGIASTKELKRASEQAKRDFELIRDSGVSTPAQITQAFNKWAEAARKAGAAAGKGVAEVVEGEVQAERQVSAVAVAFDDVERAADAAGKAGKRAGDETADSWSGAKQAVEDAQSAKKEFDTDKDPSQREQYSSGYTGKFFHWDVIGEDLRKQIKNIYETSYEDAQINMRNPILWGIKQQADAAAEAKRSLENVMKETPMDATLASRIESFLATYRGIMSDEALSNFRSALEQYKSSVKDKGIGISMPTTGGTAETRAATATAIQQPTQVAVSAAVATSADSPKMVTLLTDIARDVATLARIAGSYNGRSGPALAGEMLHSLHEAAMRS
jgi:TP901 family phage tail tape measure protein